MKTVFTGPYTQITFGHCFEGRNFERETGPFTEFKTTDAKSRFRASRNAIKQMFFRSNSFLNVFTYRPSKPVFPDSSALLGPIQRNGGEGGNLRLGKFFYKIYVTANKIPRVGQDTHKRHAQTRAILTRLYCPEPFAINTSNVKLPDLTERHPRG